MAADSRSRAWSAPGSGPLQTIAVPAVVLAAAAAGIGYAAHHAPPLTPHTAATVLAVLAAVAALTLFVVALGAGRRHPPLPAVVAAAPGATAVRGGRADDAAFCAALHADSLGHGFFTALGPRFLRAYYRTFLDSPHAIARVAAAGELPVGFVVGVTSPRAHTRATLRRHGLRLGLAGAAALATRPLTGLRFLRTRARRYSSAWRRHRGAAGAPAPEGGQAPPTAILSHVAVVAGVRGVGVGGRLVDAFAEAARNAGAVRVVLLTLEDGDGAGAFYAARGWREGPRHATPDGEQMREWTLELDRSREA